MTQVDVPLLCKFIQHALQDRRLLGMRPMPVPCRPHATQLCMRHPHAASSPRLLAVQRTLAAPKMPSMRWGNELFLFSGTVTRLRLASATAFFTACCRAGCAVLGKQIEHERI